MRLKCRRGWNSSPSQTLERRARSPAKDYKHSAAWEATQGKISFSFFVFVFVGKWVFKCFQGSAFKGHVDQCLCKVWIEISSLRLVPSSHA